MYKKISLTSHLIISIHHLIVYFDLIFDLIEENNLDKTKIQDVVKKRDFLGYSLTSAKSGQRVHKAFNTFIQKLYYKYKALSSEL